MQPGEDDTACVFVPGSIPARLLLLYGYFVQSQRHFNLEVQLEPQVQRNGSVPWQLLQEDLRLKDGTALSVE